VVFLLVALVFFVTAAGELALAGRRYSGVIASEPLSLTKWGRGVGERGINSAFTCDRYHSL